MSDEKYRVRQALVVVPTVLLALLLLWWNRPDLTNLAWDFGLLPLCLIPVAAYAETKRFSLGRGGGFSPAPILFYAITLVLGPWALLPVLFSTSRNWRGASEKLFNVAQYIVHLTGGRMLYQFMLGLGQGLPMILLAHAVTVCAVVSVNLALVTLYRVASGIETAAVLWSEYYFPLLPIYLDNLCYGVVGVLAIDTLGWLGTPITVFLALSKAATQASEVGGVIGRVLSAEMLVQAVDAKDAYTKAHSERVARYAQAIGRQLQLSGNLLRDVDVAAQLHDIGMISVPDAVLQKVGQLTDREYLFIREHPSKSRQILAANPEMSRVAEIVSQHHERYDGKGYPSGLRGEAIRLEARIIACADAFDAMTTSRSYKPTMNQTEAVAELYRHRGTQFDPLVVDALVRHLGLKAEETMGRTDFIAAP